MSHSGRHTHRSEGTRSARQTASPAAHRAPKGGARRQTAQKQAGLTLLGTVGAVVSVVVVLSFGVLAPSGAATGKWWHHPGHPRKPTRTVTATVTVTTTPHAPQATVTKAVPGPTQTVTVTAAPPAFPTGSPTSGATTTAGPTAGPTAGSGTGTLGVGVYMSGNNAGLDDYTSSWAVQPNVASFYLNWNSKTPALMKTYAAQGREIQAELSTKIVAGSWVTWSDIAKGTYDDHIISVIKSLDSLGTRVMLALDVEPDGNYDNGSGNVQQGQTPAQYVAAANHVADLIHANSTHVQSLVWLAGYRDASTSASFLPAHSKLDNVGWDPYKTGSHQVGETATQLFSKFVDSVLVPYGYADLPRHILETGIMTDPSTSGATFSSQTQIDFLSGIPAAMKAEQISSVIWFRANSGAHHYIPTDSAVDKAFATMTGSAVR